MGRGTGPKIVIFPRSVSSPELSGAFDKHFHVKNDLPPNCHSTLRKPYSSKELFQGTKPSLSLAGHQPGHRAEAAEFRFGS